MKSEAETSIPTLLEWLDAELEYHGMMMECCQAGRDGIFTEHNIAHLHLTRIRAMVVEHSSSPASNPEAPDADPHTPHQSLIQARALLVAEIERLDRLDVCTTEQRG